MIISHHRKFIFIKPMKVAGTSLEIALSKYCGPGDVITPFGQQDEAKRRALGYQSGQNNLLPWTEHSAKDWARLALRRARRKKFFSHEPAATIRRLINPDIWNSYLKISVVRNPYDYAVSRYFWEDCRAARNPGTPPLPPFGQLYTEQPELLLENRRITHIAGTCAANVMIRYEQFDEDLAALSVRLGLSDNLADDLAGISVKTSSRPKSASSKKMFSEHPDCLQLVEILCRDDIDTYGYQPPL